MNTHTGPNNKINSHQAILALIQNGCPICSKPIAKFIFSGCRPCGLEIHLNTTSEIYNLIRIKKNDYIIWIDFNDKSTSIINFNNELVAQRTELPYIINFKNIDNVINLINTFQ